jgi:hypothetical protein
MGLLIANQNINRLCIIDDDEGSRASYVEAFYDTSFDAIPQDEVNDIGLFFEKSLKAFDAVISDHQLKKKKNYFPINGAQVVSMCYERLIPSLLVTRYDPTQKSEIRKFRNKIPVIINPSDFGEETVVRGLETCINEFNGQLRADRRLWRTLVRIDSFDENHIYIIIPGWDTTEAIAVGMDEIPANIIAIIEEDKRLHVEINIGCESVNDLYFGNWEIK